MMMVMVVIVVMMMVMMIHIGTDAIGITRTWCAIARI
jgi:hypothetical protein